MKAALLALAVILGCAAYELGRESSLAADIDTRAQIDRLLMEGSRAGSVWLPAGDDGDNAYVRSDPRGEDGRAAQTGSVEREQSIRLFGPGVSRRQQIRI